MKNDKTWMVVFDATKCHFYHYDKDHLDLFKKIDHLENRNKGSSFCSDRPGRYKTSLGRGAYSKENDPKTNQICNFAKEIDLFLEKERASQHYEKLIFVAEPRMMGRIKKCITKNVKRMIQHEIQKDLTKMNDRLLLNRVNQNLHWH